MKKTRFAAIVCAMVSAFSFSVFAKTHMTDIIPTDTVEYTLEKEEKLIAELITDTDGLYSLKLVGLSSSEKITPRLSVKITDGKETLVSFVTENPFLTDGSLDTEKFVIIQGLPQGEYKVIIENLRTFSDVSFRIETTFTEEENIETPCNNSFEKATPMALRTKYYGGISAESESDYFCFDMPYEGYAFIEMYSQSVKFFRLFDENKHEIGYIDVAIDEADKIYELRTGLGKGRYYIQVTPYEDLSSPLYSLEVIANPKGDFNFEKEYNNQKDFANEIELGKEYQGNLFGIEDEDIYSFTLSDSCDVIIDFIDTRVADKGHYSIWISDGKQVIYSSDDCGRDAVTLKLSDGTYYFCVSSLGEYRFTGMAYKLKITPDKKTVSVPSVQEKPDEAEKGDTEDAGFGEFGDEALYQFEDVSESDWYAEDVLEARKAGLIQGVSGGNYKPKSHVTIAEVITMASRAHSAKYGSQVSFINSDGKWYDVYVDYAIDVGIIKKDDFTDYTRNATRAETAYIFSGILNESTDVGFITIPDVAKDAEYGDSIYKLYGLGILKGDDKDGTFYPDRNLTRAEAAVILLRIHRFSPEKNKEPIYELPVVKPEIAIK